MKDLLGTLGESDSAARLLGLYNEAANAVQAGGAGTLMPGHLSPSCLQQPGSPWELPELNRPDDFRLLICGAPA